MYFLIFIGIDLYEGTVPIFIYIKGRSGCLGPSITKIHIYSFFNEFIGIKACQDAHGELNACK